MFHAVPAICLITDRTRLIPATDDSVVRLAASAAAAGVHLIQVREKDRDDRALLALARRVAAATAGSDARVVVNERADIAIAAGVSGVHLRGDSVSAARVRAVGPPGFVIGRSVHSAAEAVAAVQSGADYLVMGTIFATSSKPGVEPAGIAGLTAVCGAVPRPVLAVGGVSADTLAWIAAAGADGIAAIGLFSETHNDHRHGNLDAALAELVTAIRREFAAGARS